MSIYLELFCILIVKIAPSLEILKDVLSFTAQSFTLTASLVMSVLSWSILINTRCFVLSMNKSQHFFWKFKVTKTPDKQIVLVTICLIDQTILRYMVPWTASGFRQGHAFQPSTRNNYSAKADVIPLIHQQAYPQLHQLHFLIYHSDGFPEFHL